MYSLSRFKEIIFAKDFVDQRAGRSHKKEIVVLHHVSFLLAAAALLFLGVYGLESFSLYSLLFLNIPLAFVLIPFLARKGYETSSKFLLLAFINIGILILSTVIGNNMFIQAFFIPACGLSILLFDSSHSRLRNIGISFSAGCFLVLNYLALKKVYLTTGEDALTKWSILAVVFITTWMIFNKFTEWKEQTEEQNRELLDEKKSVKKELLRKKEELEEKVQALKDAKQKVKEESKAKTDFLSSMSHEIRTPMNAIIGMTNLLVRENPREDQLDQLETLDFSAKTLLALVNDMFDFSRIESGTVEFESVAFNLNNLLDSLLDDFKFIAEKRDVQLYVHIADDMPEMILGDPNRLNQILSNLVSNAVKFTEAGSVGIRVEKMESEGSELNVLFEVMDTGIGIPKEKQTEVFDRFTREETHAYTFGGAGLGLTISKKLVEFQGGRIYVESETGKGSTFFVEMSFEFQDDKKIDTSVHHKIVPEGLEGATVLVVEDNVVNQKVLSRFLEKWGIEVIIAEDGQQALVELNSNLVSLILMDLQMPEVDGYEATRLIRSHDDSQKSNIPIIALTAAALKEVKEKVLATGMDDYLTKPFNPDELHKKLKSYILNNHH